MLCAAGLLIAFHPTLLSRFARVQEDIGDTRFNHWLLEHGWLWLRRDPAHLRLFDPPMFYPARNTLAYSDLLLGAAPVYWLWRAIGFAPDTSLQLWQLATSILNFAAALWALRGGLRLRPWSSAAGAALFAFAATRIAQLSHLQLLADFTLPLLVLSAVRFAQPSQPPGRWIGLGAIALVDQLYAGFYLGWFQGFALGIALVLCLSLRRTRTATIALLRQRWRSLSAAAAAAAVALAPLAYHYGIAERQTGGRPYWEVVAFLPRLASWLGTTGQSWLYGWTRPIADRFVPYGTAYEHILAYGALTTVLAVAGLIRRRRDTAFLLVGACTLTLFAITFLAFGHLTLWRVVHAVVPGARAMRAVGRVGLVILFPISAGVAALLDEMERRHRWAVAVPFLAAAVLLEQGTTPPSFDKETIRADVAWLAQRVPSGCRTFLFTPVQGALPWYKYELDAMWAADALHVPTIDGYSGHWPPWHIGPAKNTIESPQDRVRVAALLDRWLDDRHVAFDARCWIAAVPRDSQLAR